MTLLELLVKELPGKGGWPGSVYEGEELELQGVKWGYKEGCYPGAFNTATKEVVIRSEYETALKAAQQQAWDGEGLPPVGCDVELVNHFGEDFPEFAGETGDRVKIIGNGFTNSVPVAFYEADGGRGMILSYAVAGCFRPIRTEAERRRDEIELAITFTLTSLPRDEHATFWAGKIYDAIAAGKIPGVKLEE